MMVWAIGRAGSDTGDMNGIAVNINAQQPGSTYSAPLGPSTVANRFGASQLNWSWLVPANGSPQFSLSVTWAAVSSGTTYVQAEHTWMMFRQ
jgi:hypothetical protein